MTEPAQRYEVLSRLRHDGTTYEPGMFIALTESQASSIGEAVRGPLAPGEPRASSEPSPERRAFLIRAAITDLASRDPERTGPSWTAQGVPDVAALSESAGFRVSAKERDAAWAELEAQAQA